MDLPAEGSRPVTISDEDLLNNCPPVEIPPLEFPFHLSDGNNSRLVLSQVVCENFKSYGGRRVLGPFHKNFTCVIGPNGSGKSNVIDALLFVFGFRASKVRSKKLSSLIHNSDDLPNVNFCQVAVYFQRIVDTGNRADDFEVVPGSEFVISRKAFKDNSNSYYINDCKASFKEVTGLLRQHGIDLDHNRFLILQGEVEQISLMKPKATTEYETGFLEYLEDIIGSNRFKLPLAILADRIERLKDIRLEKLARVKAVEKERNELETVKDEAVAYLRLINKMTRIKNVIYQKKQHQELANESRFREELVTVKQQVEKFTKEVTDLVEELHKLTSKRDEDEKRASILQEQHRAAKAQFAGYEAEDSRMRDEHAHLKAQGKRTVKALAAEKKKLDEIRRLPEEAEERRETLKAQLAELEANRAKQEAIYKETMDILTRETAPLRKKMEAAEAALAPVQKAADEAASKLAIARQELDLAMSAVRREEERAKGARDGAQSARDRLAERERQLAEAKRNVTPQQLKELQKLRSEVERIKAEEKQLVERVNQLRSSLMEAKSSFQSDNSRNRVLTALSTAAQEGKLKGIIGRLGDLGVIPQKYDIAISTSCGALDHIVVETMELAQRAVEYLKKHSLGQASFIALDKMQSWTKEAAKPFVGPVPSAQRLFDLVDTSVNPRVKPCFYFALRNTLIADNLDVAVDWAFKHKNRFRVVTLQGQLIETSGAMSGGGSGRPVSGRMNTDAQKARRRSSGVPLFTETFIAEKETELADCEVRLTKVRQRREQLEDTEAQLSQRIQEAQRVVTKCQNEMERLREEAEVLEQEAAQAEVRAAQTGPSAKERERMEGSVANLERLHASKAEKAEVLRKRVDEVKTDLVDAGSARLAAVRSRVGLVESKIKETNDLFTKLEVDIKSAHRNQAKCEAKVKAYEEEVENLKAKLTAIDARMVEIEKTAKVCMEEFQELQKTIKDLTQGLSAVGEAIEKVETALAASRKAEVGVQRKAEELRTQAKEAGGRARGWQMKLRSLRLHTIEDDDDDEGEAGTTEDGVESGRRTSQSMDDVTPCSISSSHACTSSSSKEKSLKLPVYTEEQLAEMKVNEAEVRRLEEQTAAMAPNMSAIEQYRKKVDLYLKRVAELDQVTELRSEQLRQEADAKTKRLSEFMSGFNIITTRLKEMYQMLTQGGDAELELIDSLDPFSEGIVFSVRPPKKTWKSIANLSGGEKTLSSLALVFALHHYKPTPLYVMDEIDAALDFKNVSIVGNYVVERTKNAQFVIISLRNNMFELADRLVGIYKTHNITKSIALDCASLSRRLEAAVAARLGTKIQNNSDKQCVPPKQEETGRLVTAMETAVMEPARSTCSTDSAQTFIPQMN
ncbi:Structural maintenance of chromosomes protein 4 [Echinococcus granulosus]|uniref:Structural maintenance of chromosomes protein n=1 Tax=Echinococcus granulosus TaxID=6210 RepID=U6J9U7_ECHGR|nr:Structural maintenance of chromosomes protein 4 [Echinococcus granulosus]EUB57814.1 Structural maintenance of chromosomes protein 4 [Echinococcus granulosus]KAH9279146.1 Structural maintenance of chromosomes protein 4 [Echinococcus granulosus]CDS20828.1 structural maintenance of chromosomes protein [Echinococcus granulosus]